ncbi:STAS-like domain-containing protein [Microbacterium sp. P5_E9]
MAERPLSIKDAAQLVGLSVSRVRQLTDLGVLSAETTPGGHRRFDRATLMREWQAHRGAAPTARAEVARPEWSWRDDFVLENLSEDDVWRRLRDELEGHIGALPVRARAILNYAVTEMVNNAIDHSRGSTVVIDASLAARTTRIAIGDDGVGVFANLATLAGLSSPAEAVVEITKGKRTTAPAHHSGEGIFFTSKAVDSFDISANGFRVVFDNLIEDVAFGVSSGAGTTVVLILDLDTQRDLVAVFDAYADEESGFHRTTPRIQLVSVAGDFISRSEAKRFAAGLEQFTRVELDFAGVELIGQGFADELFRVWRTEHPGTALETFGANRGVQLMIDRVRRETG